MMAYAWYYRGEAWPKRLAAPFSGLTPLLEHKYYVDEFYQATIVGPLWRLSRWFSSVMDQKGIDFTVNWLGSTSLKIGEGMRRLQSGSIPVYAFSIFVGVVVIIAYFLFAQPVLP